MGKGEKRMAKRTVKIGDELFSPTYGFIYRSGDKRGHGKTPLFMAGMKCLPLCKVPLLSAANNCVESQNEHKVKK